MFKRWLLITCTLASFGLIESEAFAVSEYCKKWLKALHVEPHNPDCAIECISIGMFDCEEYCPEACGLALPQKALLKYVYYPGLTRAERAMISTHPKEAFKVFLLKQAAEERTLEYFPDGRLDDESDAFRHFLWAALLYKDLGKKMAEKFLDAHEDTTVHQNILSKNMDLLNNRKGLQFAENLKNEGRLVQMEIEWAALQELKNKKLVVLRPGRKIPEKVLK